jgi:transposase
MLLLIIEESQVKLKADKVLINIDFLPAYSPDFMPVEHLWQWFREEITYYQCYGDELELFNQVVKSLNKKIDKGEV